MQIDVSGSIAGISAPLSLTSGSCGAPERPPATDKHAQHADKKHQSCCEPKVLLFVVLAPETQTSRTEIILKPIDREIFAASGFLTVILSSVFSTDDAIWTIWTILIVTTGDWGDKQVALQHSQALETYGVCCMSTEDNSICSIIQEREDTVSEQDEWICLHLSATSNTRLDKDA